MSLADIPREFRELPIGLIDEPVRASRSAMDDAALEELAENIRQNGIISPLSVARIADRFEVIAGHRRRLAAALAGLAAVPCVVYPDKSAALEAIKFAENRHREELPPAHEAIWFHELLESDAGGDVDRLCALLREKRSYVEGRLNLLAGDIQIFEALEAGKIGVGIAQQLNRCDAESHRRMLLHQAITGGATVSIVAGWIAEYLHLHKPALASTPDPAVAVTPSAVPEMDFFRCVLCGKNDAVHAMQPANMHTYCRQATFDTMLELWNRRHEYARRPRSTAEALDYIGELTDLFPDVLRDDPRRI